MIDVIISIYIKVLNILYKFTKKLTSKTRNIILMISCLYFAYWRYIYSSNNDPFFIQLDHTAIILCLVLFVAVIVSNDRVINEYKYNKKVFCLYLLVLIGAFIRYIFHGINEENSYYFVFAVVLAIVFPCIYIIWNNRKDYDTIFDKIAFSYAIIGFLYFINLYFLALNGNMIVYKGMLMGSLINSNFVGEMSICCVVSSLYLLYKNDKKIIRIILYGLCLSSGIVMTLMSNCRSALLCIVLSTIVVTIFYFKNFKKNKQELNRLIIIVLICLISTLCLNFIGKYYVSLQNKNLVIKENVEIVNKNDINTTKKDSINGQHMQEQKELIVINENIYFNSAKENDNDTISEKDEKHPDYMETLKSKFTKGVSEKNLDIDKLSSGRLNIWIKYFRHLNMFGNELYELKEEFGGGYVPAPHNAIIDVAYRYGIPTGIVYVCMLLYIGIYALKLLFDKSYNSPINLFVILVIAMYSVYVMFNTCLSIFNLQPALMYYFAIIPVFDKDIIFVKKRKK